MTPVGGAKFRMRNIEDGFHATPRNGIRWAAENEPEVKENRTDLRHRDDCRQVCSEYEQGAMRFSARTGWELGENALAAKLRERRVRGDETLDLTASNPTARAVRAALLPAHSRRAP